MMTIKDFIFSEKRSDRIKQHLLFWFCYWVFLTLLHAPAPGPKHRIDFFWNLPFAAVYSFFVEVPQVFFTYTLISFVLPKYLLKSRYFFSFLWIIFFIILTGIISYPLQRYAHPIIAKAILPEQFIPTGFFMGQDFRLDEFIGCFKGTLVAAAAACSVRLVKHWHLKEKRSLELLKEKTQAQLQLLRAQVHPHFLFNTLNNIYSKAQNESPASAKMIMELSHILRYVLDEGKQALVPLERELQMLVDYITLEKMRYDDKLDLYLSLPSQTEDLYIAPLLLLPFVENSFKHGTSRMLNNLWINLKIELNETSLAVKLMNGKRPYQDEHVTRAGRGIENVKKRLELLYEGKYDLQILEDDEVFIVNLTLALTKAIPSADDTRAHAKIEYAL